MKNNRKKWIVALFAVLLLVITIIAFEICFVDFDNYRIQQVFYDFKENENKFIVVAEDLLKEEAFDKEGTYSLYISDNLLKIDILNSNNEVECYIVDDGSKDGYLKLSKDYMDYIKSDYLDEIEISVYLNGQDYSKSVTFKHSFFNEMAYLWIYYGEKDVFPSCPFDWSRRDNICEMSDNFYYAFANILDK